MRNPAKSVGRYILGILACEAVLLLAWMSLGPDASATGYTSVQSLLDSIGNSQPQDKAYLLLAAQAIRGSSRNVHILGTVALLTSLTVVVLSVIIAMQLRSREIQKNDVR